MATISSMIECTAKNWSKNLMQWELIPLLKAIPKRRCLPFSIHCESRRKRWWISITYPLPIQFTALLIFTASNESGRMPWAHMNLPLKYWVTEGLSMTRLQFRLLYPCRRRLQSFERIHKLRRAGFPVPSHSKGERLIAFATFEACNSWRVGDSFRLHWECTTSAWQEFQTICSAISG